MPIPKVYAFPHQVWNESQNGFFQEGADPGMELRDYFAAKHMAANADNDDNDITAIAEEAYEMADAMMLARERSRERNEFNRSMEDG